MEPTKMLQLKSRQNMLTLQEKSRPQLKNCKQVVKAGKEFEFTQDADIKKSSVVVLRISRIVFGSNLTLF